MKLTRREFATLLGSAASLPVLGNGSPALAKSKQVFKYGTNHLDWYPAKGNVRNAPIVIFVHGGAWALGNRGQVHSKPEHFTSNGYHFVSVSYTLLPKADAQTQATQIGEAVNWVHRNALPVWCRCQSHRVDRSFRRMPFVVAGNACWRN